MNLTSLSPHHPLSPSWLRRLVTLGAALACLGAQAAPAAPPVSSFQWSAFLGPFHMVLLHFPIGFLTLAAVLEVWFLCRRPLWARQANRLVLPLAALSAAIAAGLGWLRAGGGGEFDPGLLQVHRWTGVGIVVFTTVAALSQPRSAPQNLPGWGQSVAFRVSLGIAVALLGAAGHFGGSLTHGSGFLTRNAPALVRQALGETTDTLASTPASPSPARTDAHSAQASSTLYRTVIQPALQQRCYSCHGPEKQKGKLRLDRRENALAGGESGEPAIQPGDIRKSRILYHLLVPREHDDAMPPDGKEPLSPEQVLALSRWIQQGASFD